MNGFGILEALPDQFNVSLRGGDPACRFLLKGVQDVKDALKENTANAVARGVFGAPTFFVGEDMFWGQDRLHFVDAALARLDLPVSL